MGKRIGKAILVWVVLPAVFCAVGFLVVGPNIGKPPPEAMRELVKSAPEPAAPAPVSVEDIEPEAKPAFPEPETKLTVTRVRGNYRREGGEAPTEPTSSPRRSRPRSAPAPAPEPSVEPLPEGTELPAGPDSSDQ